MAVEPEQPFNREEMYLANAAGEGVEVPPCPWSRKEAYLAAIGGRLDGIDERIAALSTDISLKGSVATETDLPSGAAVGDAYITEDTGVMYVWVGDDWVALGGTGINVVQTTGTSQTDVMSQNAVTSMVYADPATKQIVSLSTGTGTRGANTVTIGRNSTAAGSDGVAIGNNTNAGNSGYSVALGTNAGTTAWGGIAIGNTCYANGYGGIAIGAGSRGNYAGSIGLGAGAQSSAQGELAIGTNTTSYGYNNTNYRLITGVHDGQSQHDAATLAQGNTLGNTAPTTATVGAVGQLYTDTSTNKLYHCTAVTAQGTTPETYTYTWEEVGGGGGGGGIKALSSADYNWHSTGTTNDKIALWKLPSGIYSYTADIAQKVYLDTSHDCFNYIMSGMVSLIIINQSMNGAWIIMVTSISGSSFQMGIQQTLGETGTPLRPFSRFPQVFNDLTHTSQYDALSANQGKVLKDLIDNLTARVAALEGQ